MVEFLILFGAIMLLFAAMAALADAFAWLEERREKRDLMARFREAQRLGRAARRDIW